MAGRRRAFPKADLFDDRALPRWIVVKNAYGRVIETTPVPPGTDLMRLFLSTLLRYHDDGWRLNEFSSHLAEFFATKDSEKRNVQITSLDPAAPPRPYSNYGQ